MAKTKDAAVGEALAMSRALLGIAVSAMREMAR
jgi:hypothetical protein